jgi:cytochrome P450
MPDRCADHATMGAAMHRILLIDDDVHRDRRRLMLPPFQRDAVARQTPVMAQAAAEGKGAVSLDGRLIDYASIRQAEVLVEKAKAIAGA